MKKKDIKGYTAILLAVIITAASVPVSAYAETIDESGYIIMEETDITDTETVLGSDETGSDTGLDTGTVSSGETEDVHPSGNLFPESGVSEEGGSGRTALEMPAAGGVSEGAGIRRREETGSGVNYGEDAGRIEKDEGTEAGIVQDGARRPGEPADENDKSEETGSTETVSYEEFIYSVGFISDSNELFEEYIKHQTGLKDDGAETVVDRVLRSSGLNTVNLDIYRDIVPNIRKVARGELSSTQFPGFFIDPAQYVSDGSRGYYSASELGVATLWPTTPDGRRQLLQAYLNKIGIDDVKVSKALLADMPYELYWFDKTKETGGLYISYNAISDYDETGSTAKIKYYPTISCSMRVVGAYSVSKKAGTYSVDTELAKQANRIVDTVKSVVNKYKNLSNYEKVRAYKNWICDEVSYDHAAASAGGPYGNPWQIIYVFDNDPSTKVVCEGYAKAFKFLCDLSEFTNVNVDCYLMSGTMSGGTGAGRHMWNTMLMDDGKYYLVDVTNCDDGTIGSPYQLFLAGRDGTAKGYSADRGFYVTCNNGKTSTNITYLYTEDYLDVYTKAERTINDKDYDPSKGDNPPRPNVCKHTSTKPVNVKEPDCTKPGYSGDQKCVECGEIIIPGNVIPALGHDMDEGRIIKEATSYSEGLVEFRCKRQGCSYIESRSIPMKEEAGSSEEDSLIRDITFGRSTLNVQTKGAGTGKVVTTASAGGDVISSTVYNEETGETKRESKIWIGGMSESYTYTGRTIKPAINVYDGVKKLSEKSDYTLGYQNNTNTGSDSYVTVTFKGAYRGTNDQKLKFTIKPASLENDCVIPDISVKAVGAPGSERSQNPVPGIIIKSTGVLLDSDSINVSYKRNGKTVSGVTVPDTYEMVITSNNKNITGTGRAKVTVTASGSEGEQQNLERGKIVFAPGAKKKIWTGKPIALTYGTDFTVVIDGVSVPARYVKVTCVSNINPGRATAVVSAVEGNAGGYTGSCKGNYTIKKGRRLAENGVDGFTYTYSHEVEYVNGRTMLQDLVIRDNGTILRDGIDYKVRYGNNRRVTDGETAYATVTGKGSYKGSQRLYFAIKSKSLNAGGVIVTADDINGSKSVSSVKITAYDVNGKMLKKNRDYRVDPAHITGPDANGYCTAVVEGAGSYYGSVIVKFRSIKSATMLSRVSLKAVPQKTYTGAGITLTKDDLARLLYTGKSGNPKYLTYGKDFVVVGYTNNTSFGTASMTVKGIGEYAGLRRISIKIGQKKGNYKGALIGGRWK